jgi:hypothetical protein
MKQFFTKSLLTASLAVVTTLSFGQTTAMNFSGLDCNGNSVDLFADLDAGKAVMLIFYMPNCGTCPPVATKMQTMANNINATHPGLVKAYAFPYQNSTTCTYSASWVTNNNLPLFAPLDSGAAQVAYYGGFGMPTVVLLGGNNHDVLFVTQNFTTGDTTTMRDLILNTFTAGTTELSMINSLEVFPNPSTDVIHLSFNVPSNTESFVELIDLDGKQVLVSEKTQFTEGLVQQELNVSGIPSGSYLVRVHMNGTIATQNVNVAH